MGVRRLLLLLPCSDCVTVLPQAILAQTALHSIEVKDLDRKAAPCDDFYEFSNGTWRANNPIPASMTRWSRRWQAGEFAKDKLHDILEAAAAEKGAAKGSNDQIIGDYYGACMDESGSTRLAWSQSNRGLRRSMPPATWPRCSR